MKPDIQPMDFIYHVMARYMKSYGGRCPVLPLRESLCQGSAQHPSVILEREQVLHGKPENLCEIHGKT